MRRLVKSNIIQFANQSKFRPIGFCTTCSSLASTFSESKVQGLFKKRDLKGSIAEFERNPTALDASFLIHQHDVPFEAGLEIYNRIKSKKRVAPLVAIIHSCLRNNRRSDMRHFLKELTTILKSLDEKQQKFINEGLWNRVIVCLTRDQMFEQDAIYWFEQFRNKLGQPDAFTYNSIMKIYSNCGNSEKCIELLDEMQNTNIKPDSFTFANLISACTKTNSFEMGKKIHNLLKLNHIESMELNTTIMNFYTKCDHPEMAFEIFKELKDKGKANKFTWNCGIEASIAAFGIDHAMSLFDEMKNSSVEPNDVTFSILLSACAKTKSFEIGKKLHQLLKWSNIQSLKLSTTIVDFYTKCGHPETAFELFKELKDKGDADVVAWSCGIEASIAAYGMDHAMSLFGEMKKCGIEPDAITFSTLLSACAEKQLLDVGKKLHEMSKLKHIQSLDLCNAIIKLYTKCEQLDVAFELFREFQGEGMTDKKTYNILLAGCADTGSIDRGKQLIEEIREQHFEEDEAVQLAMNMFYSKIEGIEVRRQ